MKKVIVEPDKEVLPGAPLSHRLVFREELSPKTVYQSAERLTTEELMATVHEIQKYLNQMLLKAARKPS